MSNWTKELFVENPELYQGNLEQRIKGTPEEIDKLLNVLDKENLNPENTLDLACGIGRHSLELAERGFKISGVDISEKYIKEARKKAKQEGLGGKAEFQVGDMRNLSDLYPQGKFKGILNLFTSFGYYDKKTNREILSEAKEIVEPNGFFVLEIKNRDWLIKNFRKKGFNKYDNWIILEKRNFNYKTSRIEENWSYLKKVNTHYELVKEFEINHQVWSLHSLINLFSKTGWEVKQVQSGFREDKKENLGQIKDFLVVAQKN